MKSQHHLENAVAYVEDDGTTGILHVVYAGPNNGAEVIGNGTLQHPLAVSLTVQQQHAEELAKLLREAERELAFLRSRVPYNDGVKAGRLVREASVLLAKVGA